MRRTLLCAAAALCAPILLYFLLLHPRNSTPNMRPSDPAESPALQELSSSHFDTTAVIRYKELDATATIRQQSPQSCFVEFTAPPSLAGMAFDFSRDNVAVQYKGMEFGFDPTSIPGGAAAKLAVSALNSALQKNGVSVSYEEDMLAVSGNTDSGAFTLTLDPETGNLLKLSVPDQQLEIEFSNFTFLE